MQQEMIERRRSWAGTMTEEQFEQTVAKTNLRPDSRSVQGAKLVMVGGISARQAAQEIRISNTAVSHAVEKIAMKNMESLLG